ncbi:hypothetical protein UF16_17540 [Chromobacterium violaceum]|nr:hypothetical protein UF16_17540 [Chromobacterium violaceum]
MSRLFFISTSLVFFAAIYFGKGVILLFLIVLALFYLYRYFLVIFLSRIRQSGHAGDMVFVLLIVESANVFVSNKFISSYGANIFVCSHRQIVCHFLAAAIDGNFIAIGFYKFCD